MPSPAARSTVALATLLALAAGCGGGSGKKNPPSGGSASLTATGSIALTANQFTTIGKQTTCSASGVQFGVAFAAVAASDQAGICTYLQAAQNKQNAKTITVAVFQVNPLGTTATVTPGTYPVSASPGQATAYGFVFVSQSDATCQATDVQATGGTVTISSITADRIVGTVDATLSNGGKVTGSFDASTCAVNLPGDVCAGDIGPGPTTCVP